MTESQSLEEQLARLREEFDQSFSRHASSSTDLESYILVDFDSSVYAIPMADLVTLLQLESVVPFPSTDSQVLGLIGYQGQSLVLLSLGKIFQASTNTFDAASHKLQWAMVPKGSSGIALAFANLVGLTSGPRLADLTEESEGGRERLVLHLPSGPTAILQVAESQITLLSQ